MLRALTIRVSLSVLRAGGLAGRVFDGSGNLTSRYLYGPAVDMILARMSGAGAVAWHLTDQLGSVRDIANPAGTVIAGNPC